MAQNTDKTTSNLPPQPQPQQQPPQQKQFRLTSEGFRKSVRQEVCQKFQKEEHLFYEELKEYGVQSDAIIDHQSAFYKRLSENDNEAIHFLLEQAEQQGPCSAKRLIRNILETIQSLHIDNQEDSVEISTFSEYQKIVDSIYDRIATANTQSSPLKKRNNKCSMEIYHIANLSLATDIFKHYQIKYQARLVEEENVSALRSSSNSKAGATFKSIYEQRSSKLWSEPFSEKMTRLEIVVLGRKKDHPHITNGATLESLSTEKKGKTKEEYQQISKVMVDFKLIYACIHPKSLEESPVHTKVNIQFKDQTPNPPYTGLTSIQMGFNFNLDDETKLLVMDKILAYYGNEVDQLNASIQERTNIILETLRPFRHKITYKQSKGIEQVQNSENRLNCTICGIF